MEQQPAQPPALKDCNNCKRKNVIPAEDYRVTCAHCREIRNKYHRKKYQAEKLARERERVELQLAADKGEVQKLGTSVLDFRPFRKLKKHKIVRTEYQTAGELYGAVRNLTASSCMPEFHGRFSIIMDSNISHIGRARLVANDLRAVANYPIPSSSHSVVNSTSAVGILFRCGCLTSDSNPKSQPTPLKASLHSNGVACTSDQAQAGGSKLAEALQASFTRECGGSIRIKVGLDQSHSLGIAGQRISIDIIH